MNQLINNAKIQFSSLFLSTMQPRAKTNQLEKKLAKLKPWAQVVFENISVGMDYNCKLKYVDCFTEFLKGDEHGSGEEFLIKNWKIETFNWENVELAFSKISNKRRLSFGVRWELFYYLGDFNRLKIDKIKWAKCNNVIHSKLKKNSLKSWQDICSVASAFCDSKGEVKIDYQTHWSELLWLRNSTFEHQGETYTIKFPIRNKDFVAYGYKLNNCLKMGSFWGNKTSEGTLLKLVVFKNQEIQGSLTILTCPDTNYKVQGMSGYNNCPGASNFKDIINQKIQEGLLKNSKQ